MVRSSFAVPACALALALLGAGPGSVMTTEPLELGTLVKSQFTAPRNVTVSVESAVFPRASVSVGVLEYPFGGPPGATVARSVVQNVLAALGSGYVRANNRPDGLFIMNGAVHAPATNGSNGVVGSTRDGEPVVAWLDGVDTKSLRDAMQSGPFVVDPGGTPGIRRDDGHRARRSLVIESDDAIAVAVTSPCGLYDLMNALLRSPQAFGLDRVDRALNLSGGPSSGLAVRLPDGRVETDPERIRIGTVLTIVRRPPG